MTHTKLSNDFYLINESISTTRRTITARMQRRKYWFVVAMFFILFVVGTVAIGKLAERDAKYKVAMEYGEVGE